MLLAPAYMFWPVLLFTCIVQGTSQDTNDGMYVPGIKYDGESWNEAIRQRFQKTDEDVAKFLNPEENSLPFSPEESTGEITSENLGNIYFELGKIRYNAAQKSGDILAAEEAVEHLERAISLNQANTEFKGVLPTWTELSNGLKMSEALSEALPLPEPQPEPEPPIGSLP